METLIFVILKVIELSIFIFVPYIVGHIFNYLTNDTMGWLGKWFSGIVLIWIGIIIFTIMINGIPAMIKANWQWTSQIIQYLQ